MTLGKRKKALAFMAAIVLSSSAAAAASDNGVGTVTVKQTESIASGVVMQRLEALDGSRKQNIHTLSFSPTQSDYMLLSYFGDDLFSRHTLTEMAAHAQAAGYEVVGGINGDFFNVDGTVSGMPVGPLIQNDRVICSEDIQPNITGDKAPVWQTIGFKRDGSSLIGHLVLSKTMTVVNDDGSTKKLDFTLFNRKLTTKGVHVYTADYGTSVGNAAPAFVVTLTVEQGDFTLDQTVVCRVERVQAGVTDAPIPKNGVLLCAYEGTLNEALLAQTLSQLEPGRRIDLCLSGGSRWNGVFQAISGPDAVLASGVVTISPFVKETTYPSTLVGVKEDGLVVMVQVDGRGMGGSAGLSAKQAGQYMKSLGCVHALLFDGGGSSEMIAVRSGRAEVLNNPSDGTERRIGTCLLLVKKTALFDSPLPVIPPPPYPGETTGTTSGSSGSGPSSATQTSSDNPASSGSDAVNSETPVTTVPPEVLQPLDYPKDGILLERYINRIRGLNKGYTIERIVDGEWRYSWIFYGRQITEKNVQVHLGVQLSSEFRERIEALSGGADGTLVSFDQQAAFPGTVQLQIPAPEGAADGTLLQAYAYRPDRDILERVCADLPVADGRVTLSLTQPDDLLVTAVRLVTADASQVSSAAADALAHEGRIWPWILGGIAALLAGGGVTAAVLVRRRKTSDTPDIPA